MYGRPCEFIASGLAVLVRRRHGDAVDEDPAAAGVEERRLGRGVAAAELQRLDAADVERRLRGQDHRGVQVRGVAVDGQERVGHDPAQRLQRHRSRPGRALGEAPVGDRVDGRGPHDDQLLRPAAPVPGLAGLRRRGGGLRRGLRGPLGGFALCLGGLACCLGGVLLGLGLLLGGLAVGVGPLLGGVAWRQRPAAERRPRLRPDRRRCRPRLRHRLPGCRRRRASTGAGATAVCPNRGPPGRPIRCPPPAEPAPAPAPVSAGRGCASSRAAGAASAAPAAPAGAAIPTSVATVAPARSLRTQCLLVEVLMRVLLAAPSGSAGGAGWAADAERVAGSAAPTMPGARPGAAGETASAPAGAVRVRLGVRPGLDGRGVERCGTRPGVRPPRPWRPAR